MDEKIMSVNRNPVNHLFAVMCFSYFVCSDLRLSFICRCAVMSGLFNLGAAVNMTVKRWFSLRVLRGRSVGGFWFE